MENLRIRSASVTALKYASDRLGGYCNIQRAKPGDQWSDDTEVVSREYRLERFPGRILRAATLQAALIGRTISAPTPPPAQAQAVMRGMLEEMGEAEWGTDEHGADMFHKFINKWYGPLTEALTAPQQQADGLRAALTEIETQCDNGMGEWCSVVPPHLPADVEILYDIRENICALLAELEGPK